MSQQWPPAQPDVASGASSGPQDEPGTRAVPGDAPLCPRCNQVLDPGSRFCQSCGAEIGEASGAPAIEDEKPRPLWFIVALAWLILSVLALYFLYSWAFLVG